MADLTDQHKEEIVLLLARFQLPSDVAVHFRTEHGLEIDIQQIVKYDPTRIAFAAGEKWRPIFEAARKEYIEDVSKVPVANQAYRLNLLQEGIAAAKKAKNWKLVAELTEQASKEAGGVFTNARDLNINDRRVKDMSSEDRMAALGSFLAEAMDKRAAALQVTKH